MKSLRRMVAGVPWPAVAPSPEFRARARFTPLAYSGSRTRAVRSALLACLAGCGLLPLAVLCVSTARAVDPLSRLTQGPLIRFSERSVDFGRIPQHVSRAHNFVFRNDGTQPLRILKVTPDCGCTLAEPADTLIAPGAASSLRVVFSSGDYEGDLRKVVILETNDPAEPRIDLLIKVQVAPEVEVSDRLLDFGRVHRGQTPALSTTLKAEPGVAWQVKTPAGGEDLVRWTVAPDPQTGPNAWKLEARIRPDAPFGRFNLRVDVPLVHPKVATDRISIRGFIHSYFCPLDSGINFGSTTVGAKESRTLRLQADGPGDYQITSAQPSAAWLGTSLRRDGRDYLLTVSLNPPDPVRVRETVKLLTTDPQQPEMVIEVRGTVR